MKGKRIVTGFFEVFVKPTVKMTAGVTATTCVGLAINSVATNTYEYAVDKINQHGNDPHTPPDISQSHSSP